MTTKKLNIVAIARECIKAAEAAGAREKIAIEATKLFEQRVRSDQVLRDAVMERLVHEGCYQVIRDAMHADRSASRGMVWAAPNYDPGQKGKRVVNLATGNVTMYDFRLPGGLMLGDARRPDVLAAVAEYKQQSDTSAHHARWLGFVAQRMRGDAKTVRQQLTPEQLQHLDQQLSAAAAE